jgi:hypothetical protein
MLIQFNFHIQMSMEDWHLVIQAAIICLLGTLLLQIPVTILIRLLLSCFLKTALRSSVIHLSVFLDRQGGVAYSTELSADFITESVPEPSTMAVLGLVGAYFGFRRKKKQ